MQRHPASSHHHRTSLIAAVTIFVTTACAGPTQPSGSPAPTRSEVSSATPAPTASASTGAAWERIDLPDPAEDVFGGAVPTGIAELNGTFVAVGYINAACCADGDPADNRGVVWLSADGRDWEVLGDLESFAGATVTGLATDAGRLIAYGSADGAPAAWTSADGRAWAALDAPRAESVDAQPTLVLAPLAGGLAAIVTQTDPGDGQVSSVWHSADGTDWSPTLGPLQARIADIVGLADGTILAAGTRDAAPYPDGSHRTEAVAWIRSPDGTWSEAVALGDGGASAVAGWDGRLVVAGNAGALRADGTNAWTGTLWTSSDGLAWDAVDLPIDEEDTVNGVHVIGDSLVVTGDEIVDGAANAFVLTSADGVTWTRINGSDAFSGPNNEVAAVVETADGLLAVGRRWSTELQHPLPQAWIAAR